MWSIQFYPCPSVNPSGIGFQLNNLSSPESNYFKFIYKSGTIEEGQVMPLLALADIIFTLLKVLSIWLKKWEVRACVSYGHIRPYLFR